MLKRISSILFKFKIPIFLISCTILYMSLSSGGLSVAIEYLDIPSGISTDLVEDPDGNNKYLVTLDVYTFNKPDESNHILIEGDGTNFANTREHRQVKTNHKFIYGLQKVLLIGEKLATHSIEPLLDILFANANMQDLAWMVVTKGKAADILKYKVSDYPTSSDYIKGMIESSNEQNFFSDNYKIMDAYVRVDAEGRSLVLPYVEIKNNELQIGGLAIFKKNVLVKLLDLEETKYLNILRENNARGVLSLNESFDKQISVYGKVTKKVQCTKTNKDEFTFDLNLAFEAEVINNSLYKDLLKEKEVIHHLENSLAIDIEKKCKNSIDKIQNEYRVDCLELGRLAAAKYGRGSGVDWDEIVSNSKINVKVKVKINKFGRGEYTIQAE